MADDKEVDYGTIVVAENVGDDARSRVVIVATKDSKLRLMRQRRNADTIKKYPDTEGWFNVKGVEAPDGWFNPKLFK